MKSKKVLLIIFLIYLFIGSLCMYAQFGRSTFGITELKELQEKNDREYNESIKILEHNKWVESESKRLHDCKQAGLMTIISGLIVSSIGGIMCVVRPLKK